jgi:hypothetical protein
LWAARFRVGSLGAARREDVRAVAAVAGLAGVEVARPCALRGLAARRAAGCRGVVETPSAVGSDGTGGADVRELRCARVAMRGSDVALAERRVPVEPGVVLREVTIGETTLISRNRHLRIRRWAGSGSP